MFVRRAQTLTGDPDVTYVLAHKLPGDIKAGDRLHGSMGNMSHIYEIWNEEDDTYRLVTEHGELQVYYDYMMLVLEPVHVTKLFTMEDEE